MVLNCSTSSIVCENGVEAQEVYAHTLCTWLEACPVAAVECGCPSYLARFPGHVLTRTFQSTDDETTFVVAMAIMLTLPLWPIGVSFFLPSESKLGPLVMKLRGGIWTWDWILPSTLVTLMLLYGAHTIKGADMPACVHDTSVYHQMFCEPTYYDSFARHPVNTWSNLAFLYCGLFILTTVIRGSAHTRDCPTTSSTSSSTNTKDNADNTTTVGAHYRMVDGLFSMVLLALSVFSWLWHGTNCAMVHYWDLATMDGVILFFPVRFAAVALTPWLSQRTTSRLALITYAAVIIMLLRRAWLDMQDLKYAKTFPTGNNRVAESQTIPFSEALTVGIIPVFYYIMPLLAMIAVGHSGCMWYTVILFTTLCIGWVLHVVERWAYDMFCIPESVWQATGLFHILTAITVFFGYWNVLVIDQVCARNETTRTAIKQTKNKAHKQH
eukprot:m.120889 g.120889  ORF g.120889 m.120889 type:complete len:439 (+) comp28838_c0_seq1:143-1459(+)